MFIMKAHGVQGPTLHCDLELKISYQNLFEQGGVSLGEQTCVMDEEGLYRPP